MIISNSKNYVLVKTRKVGGTSVELKLCDSLEEGDISTYLKEHTGKTNFDRHVTELTTLRKPAIGRRPVRLSEHCPLTRAFRAFGRDLENHMVISIDRNPWDLAVSHYFWKTRRFYDAKALPIEEQRARFKKYALTYFARSWKRNFWGWYKHRELSHRDLYMIDGVSMVDHMLRYECLEEDMQALGPKIGLPDLTLEGVNAKRTTRPKKGRSYQDMYDEETRDHIAKVAAWEIDAYGYDFEGKNTPHFEPDPRRHAVKDAWFKKRGV